MNTSLRQSADKLFTLLALLSVVLIVAALVVILLPMLWRGGSAVVFQGTAEFRRMQSEQFNHGDSDEVRAETQATAELKRQAWRLFDEFATVIDPSDLETRASQIHRELAAQLANRDMPTREIRAIRKVSEAARDKFIEALGCDDKSQALKALGEARSLAQAEALKGTVAAELADLADDYGRLLAPVVDLRADRSRYLEPVKQVKSSLRSLLGPCPGDPLPAIPLDQYGATRWDQATQHLERVLWAETWTNPVQGGVLAQGRIARQEQFAGTELAGLFPFVRDNVRAMLRPEWTFYWRYFTDDNISGHYFGGVGPEILGTLLVTVLAIVFALPVGVIAAAYLVECSKDNVATKVLRMSVNTLAGVPSIVFGLFGLAFFVIYLLPKLGMHNGSSILAGSLTLAVLVLPVIIRASEEAIRSVPRAYKEGSLALGASRFRSFVTVTLPAAMPGILTGLILSMSRAAGETAPILFTAGVAMGPVPTSLAQPTRTLSYSSYDMAVGDKMAMLAPHNQFGMVMTLVAIVLLLNIVAIVLRGRVSRKLRGQ